MFPEFTEWVREFVALRRDLHAHPELAFQEHRTSDIVAKKLQEFGVDAIHRGMGLTGIVATIHGKQSGNNKAIALRADMDALPIFEETQLPYASTVPGVMHACGHDGHTASLLLAAKYLATHRNFSGTVYLIFQPAEENGGGANIMIRDGLFDKFPVTSVWGLHNWPQIPLGATLVKSGPMLAAVDDFTIMITGRGGHAAYPQYTNNPLTIGAHLTLALQDIPTGDAVLTITCFHVGSANNVVDQQARLQGTIRTHDPKVQDMLHAKINEVCQSIAENFRAVIDVDIQRDYPAVINTETETEIAAAVLAGYLPKESIIRDFPPSMGSEDFAYMLQKNPGCFIGMGTGKTNNDPGLHDPRFDFNDEVLPIAATYWIKLVEANLPPT